jgi:hypothetical protein
LVSTGLIAVACGAVVIVVLKSGLNGILYTGTPAIMAAKGVETLMNDKWYADKLQWRASACILSSNDEAGIKQVDADMCTLREPSQSEPHFLVIGNSFSAAEYEMYSALSESGLGSVTATSSWGASPVPEIPNNSEWAKAKAYYWSNVVPTLISGLNKGDILIMINDLGLTPAILNADNDDRLALLRTGLKRLAGELHQKGVEIIFQSQNPFIREAQCTPDMAKPKWFNVIDPTRCTHYTKTYSIKRRKPLDAVLEDVRITNPNFHILDLFPILCPEDVCEFYNNQGVFMYWDEWSHPSIEANHLARPLFLEVVNRAIKNGILQADNTTR